jgi:Fic family protein
MYYVLFVVFMLTGVVAGYYLARWSMLHNRDIKDHVSHKRKEDGKDEIMKLFKKGHPRFGFQEIRVTNDDVERALGVSDATATNYLQELEDDGKIKQIGRRGRFVYYVER